MIGSLIRERAAELKTFATEEIIDVNGEYLHDAAQGDLQTQKHEAVKIVLRSIAGGVLIGLANLATELESSDPDGADAANFLTRADNNAFIRSLLTLDEFQVQNSIGAKIQAAVRSFVDSIGPEMIWTLSWAQAMHRCEQSEALRLKRRREDSKAIEAQAARIEAARDSQSDS